MFIEIKLLVESPIIVILSVCIKVSCTYFVTPSYTIQLIAILAGDVSNVRSMTWCKTITPKNSGLCKNTTE